MLLAQATCLTKRLLADDEKWGLCDTLAGTQGVKDEAGKNDWQQCVASRLESTITQFLCTVTDDRQLRRTERQLLQLTGQL